MKRVLDILFIEDSEDDVELIYLEMTKNGCSPRWKRVDSAIALRERLAEQQWDCIISDYKMHGFDGQKALSIVRAIDPIVPFILISGAIGEDQAVQLMKNGAQDFLYKNNLVKLGRVIDRELKEADLKRRAILDAKALKDSQERLETIYNAANDAMALLGISNDQPIFESTNTAFKKLYQKINTLNNGQDLTNMLLPFFLNQVLSLSIDEAHDRLAIYRMVIAAGEPYNFVWNVEMAEDQVYIETQLIPIVEAEKCTHILQVERDVTESVQLKKLLESENIYLKEEIKSSQNFGDITYSSIQFNEVLKKVQQVARVDATVLILGETGTGKELIARAVHNSSQRNKKPLIRLNCAALPKELIESELFGHEKGAFTGAIQQKIGRFELANGGTIFLDEIGELPIELQPKLLRVIQEEELERIGGTKTIKLDIRIIAATNRDLKKAIAKGEFREDLYYRLNVFPIDIPPLRERPEDISPFI